MKTPALAADHDAFVRRFGGVFEHSPWIAEQVFERAQASQIEPGELSRRFRDVVMSAAADRQLALLQAHPELACALAKPEQLTSESQREQAGAGLDRCTLAELDEFRTLNRAYRHRFGFPFIVAVKGLDRSDILRQFRSRLNNGQAEEFHMALEQVCKIGALRLEAILSD